MCPWLCWLEFAGQVSQILPSSCSIIPRSTRLNCCSASALAQYGRVGTCVAQKVFSAHPVRKQRDKGSKGPEFLDHLQGHLPSNCSSSRPDLQEVPPLLHSAMGQWPSKPSTYGPSEDSRPKLYHQSTVVFPLVLFNCLEILISTMSKKQLFNAMVQTPNQTSLESLQASKPGSEGFILCF